ncbi:capsule assembly Wzi family protein [Terriglobus aquaticus]|uniref:Capsule assembly Wzi family protein n=1 Tax=Terriglobus aquaticus TaxID=940139 RepID=A0ABW9KIP1_9BACT|nr:capsule assembly Wzi family protein [Terriglobus aquaticus]
MASAQTGSPASVPAPAAQTQAAPASSQVPAPANASQPTPAIAPPQQLPDGPLPARPAYLPPKTKTHSKPRAEAPGEPSNPTPPPVVAQRPSLRYPVVARNAYDGTPQVTYDRLGSAYIPVDSWMYPALLRLYSMGFLDTAFLSMRPYTRRSVLHMLLQTEGDVRNSGNEEALRLLNTLEDGLQGEPDNGATQPRGLVYGLEQVYTGVRQVGGPVLRDSFHVGQTFVNDYGRPYATGFNTYDGFATLAEKGPFSIYVRAEYQHAPHFTGYTFAQASALSSVDEIDYNGTNRPNSTIPEGVQPSQNNFRVLEATASAHVYGHEISLGKSDAWLGPGLGGAMAWSNNAENMYSFRINRVEPLWIPGVSRIFGNFRYDFFIGSLKGHTYPNAPWAHSEIISVTPFRDFQFSGQRTIIFGGEGVQPVTLGTFFKGFFSTTDTTSAQKYSRDNPGARFSSVTASWRLPFLRRVATLYADSETHDDVFPLASPRRAAWRPGIYLSQLPFAPKLDLRVEATYTDFVTTRSIGGIGQYWEIVQRQGYTNKGFLLGDWIGREGKGGNASLTYHFSGNEWLSLSYARKKNAKDFIPLGTTQNDYRVDLLKRVRPNVELGLWYQRETWTAPFIRSGQQANSTGSLQVKWYPRLRSSNDLF